MNDEWLVFDEGPDTAHNGLYVSMNKIGEIVLNQKMFGEMDRPEAVLLLFNPKTNRIGLKPASPLMPNAFPIKQKGRSDHCIIRAKPFMVKHDIRLDGTVRFRTAAVKDGILVLDLKQMSNVKRYSRSAGRRKS